MEPFLPDLKPEAILAAYRRGLFPMADPFDGSPAWYEADPRGIIPLDAAHTPKRLRRYMKRFTYDVDRNFRKVIEGCARPVTWISGPIVDAYVELHRRGHAHSVEAYEDGRLAGGIYGVHVAGAFMAESMFRAVPNASSACLVKLIERLRGRGFVLLDIQQVLPHTARFGAIEVSKAEYLRRLKDALKLPRKW